MSSIDDGEPTSVKTPLKAVEVWKDLKKWKRHPTFTYASNGGK